MKRFLITLLIAAIMGLYVFLMYKVILLKKQNSILIELNKAHIELEAITDGYVMGLERTLREQHEMYIYIYGGPEEPGG